MKLLCDPSPQKGSKLALGKFGCVFVLIGIGAILFSFQCRKSNQNEQSSNGGSSLSDLAQLKKRGYIRILSPLTDPESSLPRAAFPLAFERTLADDFCRQQGLKPMIDYVDAHDQLLDALVQGKTDLVVANLTVTHKRRQRVAFSVPLNVVRQHVILGPASKPVQRKADLAGRRVFVRRSSSYFTTLEKLTLQHPGIQVNQVEEDLDTQEILQRVASGDYDLTLADDVIARAAQRYLPEIKIGPAVTGEQPIAWAVSQKAPELRTALNNFLANSLPKHGHDQVYRADLPEIKQRKVLRLLTRNNAASYYLYRGKLVGFEYDLARKFTKQLGLQLEIVVPPRAADLVPWLQAGRGDVVAAGITLTAPTTTIRGCIFKTIQLGA